MNKVINVLSLSSQTCVKYTVHTDILFLNCFAFVKFRQTVGCSAKVHLQHFCKMHKYL